MPLSHHVLLTKKKHAFTHPAEDRFCPDPNSWLPVAYTSSPKQPQEDWKASASVVETVAWDGDEENPWLGF